MSKHTPAPWLLCKESPRIIMQRYELSPEHEGPILASVIGNDNSGFFVGEEEADANARLISAAPELLEALTELVTDMVIAQGNMRDAAKHDTRWEGCAEAIQPRIDAARATIAKARGN